MQGRRLELPTRGNRDNRGDHNSSGEFYVFRTFNHVLMHKLPKIGGPLALLDQNPIQARNECKIKEHIQFPLCEDVKQKLKSNAVSFV